jgi:RNA polymerase sigma-70 factor (ECF subfamily)
MKAGNYTSIGGNGGRFKTTHWTAIEDIRAGDDAQGRFLVGELIREYWKPVYCYLRRKGRSNEEAKDLTQDFFQAVVLGRELIRRADPAKGRFRTLLLTALDRYLANVHRGQRAQKRIPQEKLFHLEQADGSDLPEAARDFTGEESFNYAWVSDLLDRTLQEVEADCCRRGMSAHWNLFHDRVLQPIIEDRAPPPMAELCAKHGIEEATKASNMIFAVKRRLQSALARQVRESVVRDDEVSEEMAELAKFLARK